MWSKIDTHNLASSVGTKELYMANDGHKEKVEDETPTGSGKPIDLDVEGDNCNRETHDKNHEGKDVGQEGDVPKNTDLSGYYNDDDLQVWKD